MFDSYIRAVKENNGLIFPEDFCYTREDEIDVTKLSVLCKEESKHFTCTEKTCSCLCHKKALDEVEAQLGPYLYAGNYYNNPVADELVEFKEEWFQYYQFDEVAEK